MAKVKKSRCPKGSRKTKGISSKVGSRCVKTKSVKKTSTIKKKSPTKKSMKKVDTRGCTRQSSTKYMKRNSPPYPANQCCNRTMRGNDGKMYTSQAGPDHCRWVKAK